MNNSNNQTKRRWTEEEDARLLRQVSAFPQNMARCFFIVSEELNRTPSAVANHWYTVVSKKPGVLAFGTISPVHFCKNRKNGAGVSISRSLWQRFVRLVRDLF